MVRPIKVRASPGAQLHRVLVGGGKKQFFLISGFRVGHQLMTGKIEMAIRKATFHIACTQCFMGPFDTTLSRLF